MKPLSPSSPRRKYAMRFGRVLRDAMSRRGISAVRLAQATGCSKSAIATWRSLSGTNLPRLETALRLAESLECDELAAIVRESREGQCPVCGRRFINEGGQPKIYCSRDCAHVRSQVRAYRDGSSRERAIRAERQLHRHQEAVEYYCRSCEPDGLCKTGDCPLRIVSPLPLSRPIEVQLATPAPRILTAEGRAAREAAVRARWARPGEKERMAAVLKAKHPAHDPARRDAWRAAISATKQERTA